MNSSNKICILLIFLFSVSSIFGQDRIIIKTGTPEGDSLYEEIFHDHDIQIIGDSLRNHLIYTHSEKLGALKDSVLKNVFIHKAPIHEQKASRIVIKESGFFKKNKIIIDFNPLNHTILKVVENEKEVPPQKFHKYQDYLEDATDFAELEALHPRMEELEFRIQSMELPDSEQMADLEAILIDLEALQSDRALIKKNHFSSIKRIIELDNLEEVFLGILEGAGVTPPQKIESISINKGKFFVNNQEIKGAAGEKCIQAYISHTDLTPEDMQKRGEEISIDILFD